MSQTSMQIPPLSQLKLLNNETQTFALRKEGIRIESETINGKNVVHNYGQGGASIALAYGSAYIAGKCLTLKETRMQSRVAVIGAGINGLLTAIELCKRGYAVTVYADKFPQLNPNTMQGTVASQRGRFIWLPSDYEYKEDILKHELLSKLSFDYYMSCCKLKSYQSLQEVTVFEKGSSIAELKEIVSDFISDDFKEISATFNGVTEKVVSYRTISINTLLYLEELRVECVLRGIAFVERHFSSLTDLLSVPEQNILNCTDLGSRSFFQDNSLCQSQSHILTFSAPSIRNRFVIRLRNALSQSYQCLTMHCEPGQVIVQSAFSEQTIEDQKQRVASEAAMIGRFAGFSNSGSSLNPRL